MASSVAAQQMPYEAAQTLFISGKYDAVASTLQPIVEGDQNELSWVDASVLLGRTYILLGHPELSVNVLLKVYQIAPRRFEAPVSLYYLAEALKAMGRPVESCKVSTEARTVYGNKTDLTRVNALFTAMKCVEEKDPAVVKNRLGTNISTSSVARDDEADRIIAEAEQRKAQRESRASGNTNYAQSLDTLETQYAMTCGPTSQSQFKQMCPMIRAQIDQIRAKRDAEASEPMQAENRWRDDQARRNVEMLEQSRQQLNDTLAAQAAARAARVQSQGGNNSSPFYQGQQSTGRVCAPVPCNAPPGGACNAERDPRCG